MGNVFTESPLKLIGFKLTTELSSPLSGHLSILTILKSIPCSSYAIESPLTINSFHQERKNCKDLSRDPIGKMTKNYFLALSPKTSHEFNRLLEQHYLWRNQNRRFKKLSWLTANQWPQCYFDNVVNFPLLLE